MPQAMPVRPSVQQPNGTVDTDLALGPVPARPAACDTDDDNKLLVRRLTEAVRWQPEAAAAVASTIAKARSGEGKRRGMGTKADAWVLFAGPDAAGKRDMAEALSTSIFGASAVTVYLGVREAGVNCGGEHVVSWRGRTALDRVAEAIQANPFRVIVLDGVDHADDVLHGSIMRAIESGRLADSHGRDVALGSNIFVVMSQWSPLPDRLGITQEDVPPLCDSPWNLEHGTAKRRAPELPLDGDRRTKARKDSVRDPLPLDLNLSMSDHHTDDEDDSGGEGSRNSSSDLTVEHEPAAARLFSAPSNASEFMQAVDGTVVFKPVVSSEPLKRSVSDVVPAKLGNVTSGGWSSEVLCPSIRQLKRSFSTNAVVDGATMEDSGRRKDGEMFPMPVTVTVDGN